MRKIPRTVRAGQSEEFFESNYFQIGQACSPVLLINYRASKNSLFKAKLNVRAKTIQFILSNLF